MASDIIMMLILAAAACIAVLIMARVPDAPGHYNDDPTWIVAAMEAVQMVLGFYVVTWLCRMFRAFEQLLLILTGVEPGEAQFSLQATLRRLRKLIEELTT